MTTHRSTRLRFMRKLHKWLALAMGLQLLIWLCSGMLMNLIDQDIAAGSASRALIDAGDGRLIAHANDRSELMDFLLMLHFMDYLQLGSFNNPQIILFGFATLWLAISGLLLLSVNFRQRDVSWLAGWRK